MASEKLTPTGYMPPSGPPPQGLSLQPLCFVENLPFDSVKFAARGWASVSLRSLNPKLYEVCRTLIERSHEFFEFPLEEKMKHHIPTMMQSSEEGFSIVEGEKSMITLRRENHCPEVLKKAAQDVWRESGLWLEELIRGIALSLGLPETAFESLVRPCVEKFPEEKRVATLLRIFRYIRPSSTSVPEPKVASEGHRDLGLLTLCVGHSAGLQVWDTDLQGGKGDWLSIEDRKQTGLGGEPPELTATILSGQTLARLSNGRYTAGHHRVLLHPPSDAHSSPYRFSLVYALRGHLPVVISSPKFTSTVTGEYIYPFGIDQEVRMGDMYTAISKAHFNVNIDRTLRDEQRKKLKETAEMVEENDGKAKALWHGSGDRVLTKRKWYRSVNFRTFCCRLPRQDKT